MEQWKLSSEWAHKFLYFTFYTTYQGMYLRSVPSYNLLYPMTIGGCITLFPIVTDQWP